MERRAEVSRTYISRIDADGVNGVVGGEDDGSTCSYSRPRLQPAQRRPTAADASGSYSGHGRRISVSTRPGEKSSDQSRVTICCGRTAGRRPAQQGAGG